MDSSAKPLTLRLQVWLNSSAYSDSLGKMWLNMMEPFPLSSPQAKMMLLPTRYNQPRGLQPYWIMENCTKVHYLFAEFIWLYVEHKCRCVMNHIFATFLGQISVLILSHVIPSPEHEARERGSCGVCEMLSRPEKKAETSKQVRILLILFFLFILSIGNYLVKHIIRHH